MKKFFTFVGILSLGIIVGWNGHSAYRFFDSEKNQGTPKNDEHELSVVKKIKPAQPVASSSFFTNNEFLNNNQLGMVIELLKQDLTPEEKKQLNQDVIDYAHSLYVNSAGSKNVEQRLLALLGNYDTKEQVLSVLANFYVKHKQYKQAITSLYTLRSMVQFDDDFQQISRKIRTLSRKNLRQLQSYNYKSDMADFYEFMINKEPDNYEIQMEYAEFEYENRNYSHVEELLSVLIYHADYAKKSENLMLKTQHQKDMLEDGIVPVAVEKVGEHYIVSAIINNKEPVKLIIDTGATLTILSPKVIQNLGLNVDDVQQYLDFSTANGIVQAPVMQLDSMRIQNHLVSDLKVGVLSTFTHSSFDGLLGMNFLSQFAFFIDQKNSTLELVNLD